ncbi:MAG: PDDEXK nuclease domain-containing protein, partial [Saprospiraceae bacterium]
NAYAHHVLDDKQNNFKKVLPEFFAEQVNEALKSEYNLDFLGLTREAKERELESKLIENVRDFLLELGYGFCFIGSQYRLTLGEKEYFLDLLFYHRMLKCLVVIDLKVVEFIPEFAGKMNFYLEVVDDKLKQIDDKPSIGIILCPTKNDIEVEYALRTTNKPIGVAKYNLTTELPDEFKGKLPTVAEIKASLKHKL